MLEKFKRIGSAIMDAWTNNNDGINLPSEMDASQHSGDFVRGIENIPTQHLTAMHEDITAELEKRKVAEAAAFHADPENQGKIAPHDHKWKRGLLPGQKYVRVCSVCGILEPVTQEEWSTYA
jgi:hypothetical protein